MCNTALILGAGSGTRMGILQSKLLLDLMGKTVLEHSVSAFYSHPLVDHVIVVCRQCDLRLFQDILAAYPSVQFVIGGASRQQSVLCALSHVPSETELLLIHDGARPLVTADVITRTTEAAIAFGAATVGVPVKDTIKIRDASGVILSTPDRDALFSVQTPQVFSFPLYQKAVEQAVKEKVDLTDDCQLLERIGVPVHTVTGEYGNLKITTAEDLPMARAILEHRGVRSNMRIGHGYDVHRLVEERDCIIGGVHIPHCKGLLGHSDADVLLHAVTDALLGAAALGDIGSMFPDTQPEWKGADSMVLLQKAVERLRNANFQIVNIDATLLAQKPKMKPYIVQMRKNIAFACGVSEEAVSVKATTEEGLGFTGREEGIAAHAVCIIQ